MGGDMHIKSLIIENFKCYEKKFLVDFNESINIIVGNNEAGKSTILEAIHLCLTGMYNGRYLRNELSQYIFNNRKKEKYISSINSGTPESPPRVLIEIYLIDDNSSEVGILKGNGNSQAIDAPGILITVDFNDAYIDEYNELVSKKIC